MSFSCIGRVIKLIKSTLKFIEPYHIYKIIGQVAYKVALPPLFTNFHNIFHVSQLKKYTFDFTLPWNL